ncbi:cytidine deaminase [Exophiala spinifera]|uniref:Cytidine deaminase n=1 Tax=Exophiala spinifera TaxID=91928 RepID=A0A0D1YWQ2_9EURO|nr:cytidine deaminase [Exophiala spinifera]KIW19736.1 cytidine deaminase [Exophiala spinifera]
MTSQTTLEPLSKDELRVLASKAIEAKEYAYCPYSKFRVGACVMLSDGTYHTGANVEVASSPVGICAERCAIAPIVASLKRPAMPVLRAIAVATDISPPASPCGMCRQFINEFASKDLPIYMYGKDGIDSEGENEDKDGSGGGGGGGGSGMVMMTIGQLLPMSFGRSDLGRDR